MNMEMMYRNRLKMSLDIVQKDTKIQDSVKAILKQLVDYLNQNSLHLQLLEAELSHKAHSAQLSFGLSQKLSAIEFLQHFTKVEKFMENIEASRKKQEVKVERTLVGQNNKIEKIELLAQQVRNQLERQRPLEADWEFLVGQINGLKKQIEKQRIDDKAEEGNFDDKQMGSAEMMQQFKKLQEQCLKMKHNLDELIDQLRIKICSNQSQSQSKFVTFNQLREVLGQLEVGLSSSLAQFLFDSRGKISNSNNYPQANFDYTFNPQAKKQFSNILTSKTDDSQTITFHQKGSLLNSKNLQLSQRSSQIRLNWVSSCENVRTPSKIDQINYISHQYHVNFLNGKINSHQKQGLEMAKFSLNHNIKRNYRQSLYYTSKASVFVGQLQCDFFPLANHALSIIVDNQRPILVKCLQQKKQRTTTILAPGQTGTNCVVLFCSNQQREQRALDFQANFCGQFFSMHMSQSKRIRSQHIARLLSDNVWLRSDFAC